MPLRIYTLEGRYATALYSAAVKKNCLNVVESELTKIRQAVDKDMKLHAFLQSPLYGREMQKKLVTELLQKQKYSDTVVSFFQTLAEYGRLNQTLKMIQAFGQIMRAHRNEIDVVVTMAKVMSLQSLT